MDNPDVVIRHYQCSFKSRPFLMDAFNKHQLLSWLGKNLSDVVSHMTVRNVKKDEWIIRENDLGDGLYIAENGELEESRDGNILRIIKSGIIFGESAVILKDHVSKRSVKALTDCRIWTLEKNAYNEIEEERNKKANKKFCDYLRKIPLFAQLSDDMLTKLANVLDTEYYPTGSNIIRQGDEAGIFCMINHGLVRVTQQVDGEENAREIEILPTGSYFGGSGFLTGGRREYNFVAHDGGVEVWMIDREFLKKIVGDYEGEIPDYGVIEREE